MDSYSVLATLTTIDSVADGSSYSNNLRDALSPFCNAPNGTANSDQLTSTIHQISEVSSIRSLQIVSVVSVVGSIVAIFIINTLKRKMILTLTFVTAAFVFALTGATLLHFQSPWKSSITLVQRLVFILIAEIFP